MDAEYESDFYDDFAFNENDLFMWMNNGLNERGRIEGWYICRVHGEFIKKKAKKEARCPFCGILCTRLMFLDAATKYSVLKRWHAQGTYSDLAAGKIQEEKINVKRN